MAGVLSRREFTVVMAGGIAALMPDDAQTGAPPAGTFKETPTVNGQSDELTLDPRVTLLDLVREHLRLTGPKKGCDHGQCGACTMIVDGRRINSCLTLAVSVDGARITTIEGLETGGDLHPGASCFSGARWISMRILHPGSDLLRRGDVGRSACGRTNRSITG